MLLHIPDNQNKKVSLCKHMNQFCLQLVICCECQHRLTSRGMTANVTASCKRLPMTSKRFIMMASDSLAIPMHVQYMKRRCSLTEQISRPSVRHPMPVIHLVDITTIGNMMINHMRRRALLAPQAVPASPRGSNIFIIMPIFVAFVDLAHDKTGLTCSTGF